MRETLTLARQLVREIEKLPDHVYVAMSDEPLADNEIYVFNTEEAAQAFIDEIKTAYHVVSEPILDMGFIEEARLAEENRR